MKRFAFLCLVLGSMVCSAQPALADAGSLDRTFGRDGFVRNIPPLGNTVDIVVKGDGRILVADTRFRVARIEADGGRDTSFGGDGVAQAKFRRFEESTALTLDPDGRILVAGTVARRQHVLPRHLAIARFTPAGRLDRTFGGNGRVIVQCPPRPWCLAGGVAVQPNGRIVLAAAYGGFYLLRLNQRGGVDRSFGHNGHVDLRRGQCCPSSHSRVRVLGGGGIIIAGGGWLARLRPSGGLDRSFSSDGMVRLPHDINPLDVGGLHIYEDETVLVGGFDASAHWFVARYRSGGALDRTFARKGWTELSFRSQDWLNGLVVQADGRIVLVGGTFNGSSNGDFRPVIARLRANGHLDRSFSGDGKVVVVKRRGALAVGVGVQYLTGARIIVGMAGETEFVDAYPLARYLAS